MSHIKKDRVIKRIGKKNTGGMANVLKAPIPIASKDCFFVERFVMKDGANIGWLFPYKTL